MTAVTAAITISIGAFKYIKANAIVSNMPLIALPIAPNASITVPAPVKTLTNLPIKSIAPIIGGPNVIKIPANVAIKPSIMPIAGCASVSFSIKSVIAIATSNTAAAKGAIAVATLMIMLIILPNN